MVRFQYKEVVSKSDNFN